MSSLSTALGAGLALGGVLALCGSWSRGGRAGGVPHLGAGLAPAMGVVAAIRLAPQGRAVAVVAAAALGGAFGWAAHALQARATTTPRLPFGGDLAAAGVGVAVVALLGARPFAVGTSALGGAWPDHVGVTGVVVNGGGVAIAAVLAALLLARLPQALLPTPLRWTAAAAFASMLGVQAAWGAGVAAPTVPPEPLTLALAAFAAGALGRTPMTATAVGMALGLACAALELLGVPSAFVVAAAALPTLPALADRPAPESA